jgi:2-polyprenyl-6-hydroxyphenyl methylase/3-demethylubiquinone-9 3-methyltransferase
MNKEGNIAFNFGVNWQQFSQNSLDAAKFEDAFDSLDKLIGHQNIKGKTFLDIGCGSGIFAIAASLAGAAKVVGIDISRESIEVSINNKKIYATCGSIDFIHKSVLDDDILQLGRFDIVYSWGVLHHTGDMWRAIDVATRLVSADSLFVIAIYNKHWSCGFWKMIKRFYNISPSIVRRLMIWFFFVVIATAKLIVTHKNPFKKQKRGMSFYYDVIDWVGGYPYEYASPDEVINHVQKLRFECIKTVKPAVPTGCNEFVFRKI